MSGSTLCENIGFPYSSGRTIVSPERRRHPWTSHTGAATSQSFTHALNIRSTYFSVFEYPGNTRKIHGRKIKQKVEVYQSGKSIEKEESGVVEKGFDGFGRNQVVALKCIAKCRTLS